MRRLQVAIGSVLLFLAVTSSACMFDSENPGVASLGGNGSAGDDPGSGVLVIGDRERQRRDEQVLGGLVVTETEMPKDWRDLPADQAGSVDAAFTTCDGGDVRDLAASAHVEAAFGRYDTGVVGIAEASGPPEALLVVVLRQFLSDAEAAGFVADLAAAYSACPSEWVSDVGGSAATSRLLVPVAPLQVAVASEGGGGDARGPGGIGEDGIRIMTSAGPRGDPPAWTVTVLDTTRLGSTVVQLLRSVPVSDPATADLARTVGYDAAARTAMCETARRVDARVGGGHDLGVCAP